MTLEKDAGCMNCDFTTTNEEEMTAHNCQSLCNACGEFVAVDHLDASGFHKPAHCNAFELESLFIEGRLWFDKTYGNTYFSNRVWINGNVAFEMPMEYGYEEMYVHRAIQELHSRGYFVGEKIPSVWEIRDEMGIHFYKSATYGKKSELFKGARG
jgi:hypothetical protein